MKNYLTNWFILFFLFTGYAFSQGPYKIEMWGMFEGSIVHNQKYNNPYVDVELKVQWESPSGRIIDFWGFWDGGSTWKFRFMPDERGSWKYKASFSDGSYSTSGEIKCTDTDNPGMIVADKVNPNWFGFSSGEHGMIRSLHVGDCFFATNWDDPKDDLDTNKRIVFLNWLEENEYNLLSIGSHFLNREHPGRGKGWYTPDLWPLNVEEYQKMEIILNELAERRIHVFPFAGFMGKASDFPVDPAEQETYIKYTIARLGPYYNLLFNVAGPEPMKSGEDGGKPYQFVMDTANIGRLGMLIKKYDPFGHMLTVHNKDDGTIHRKSQWLTYQALQGGKSTNLEAVYTFLRERHEEGKPTYAQEIFWPGNKWHNGGNSFTEDEIRRKGILMIMAQTTINYADMDGNSSTGFSGQPEMERLHQNWHDIMHKIWDLFDTTDFYQMNPANEMVSAGFCLADQQNKFIIYLPEGNPVDVKTISDIPYVISWLNAENLTDWHEGGETLTGKSITPPAPGEWLLFLNINPDATSITRGNYPDIARDKKGNLHLAYNRDGLKYMKYDVSSKQWSDEQDTGCECENVKRSDPDVVVSSKGYPQVYCGREFARWTGKYWQQINPKATRDTEIAIDANDNVFIIDRGGNQDGHIGISMLSPNADEWVILTDPDTGDAGDHTNHVYPDLEINKNDNTIHLVQRHGPLKEVTYRFSSDGGISWAPSEPISNDRFEGPHIVVDHKNNVYVTTGNGVFFKRIGKDVWHPEGRILDVKPRFQPELSVDAQNNIYVTSFGGKYNIRAKNGWLGEKYIHKISSAETIGFTEAAGANDFVYVVWEEGHGEEEKGLKEDAYIFMGKLYKTGRFEYLFKD